MIITFGKRIHLARVLERESTFLSSLAGTVSLSDTQGIGKVRFGERQVHGRQEPHA